MLRVTHFLKIIKFESTCLRESVYLEGITIFPCVTKSEKTISLGKGSYNRFFKVIFDRLMNDKSSNPRFIRQNQKFDDIKPFKVQ